MYKRFMAIGAISAMAFLLAPLQVSAQTQVITGSKTNTTKTVDIQPFEHLRVEGSIDVVYTVTEIEQPRVEFFGPDNIVPLLKTNHDGKTLSVFYSTSVKLKKQGKLVVKIYGPAASTFTVMGSGEIQIPKGVSTAASLTFNISGSGDIVAKNVSTRDLQVNIEGSGDVELSNARIMNVTASVSGSGNVKLTGKTTKASYTVTGSGDIDAKKLEATNVNITISGSGDVSCHAVSTLTGKVSGSGEINYTGNPEVSLTNNRKGKKKL